MPSLLSRNKSTRKLKKVPSEKFRHSDCLKTNKFYISLEYFVSLNYFVKNRNNYLLIMITIMDKIFVELFMCFRLLSTASELELNYYHQIVYVRVVSRPPKQRKTWDQKICCETFERNTYFT